jgi:hypothetical protein
MCLERVGRIDGWIWRLKSNRYVELKTRDKPSNPRVPSLIYSHLSQPHAHRPTLLITHPYSTLPTTSPSSDPLPAHAPKHSLQFPRLRALLHWRRLLLLLLHTSPNDPPCQCAPRSIKPAQATPSFTWHATIGRVGDPSFLKL